MGHDLVEVHCQWWASTGWYLSLCHHLLTMNSFMATILHLEPFTLDLAGTFRLASMEEHVASHWSTLEESCLPNTGQVLDNLVIVAIPQSHSLLELFHLGWNWYILLMLCVHPHTVECPSLPQEQWEDVSYKGWCIIDFAHLSWCTKGHHSQLDVPFIQHVLPSIFDFSLPLIWVWLY